VMDPAIEREQKFECVLVGDGTTPSQYILS
jgi:hypothetical protein